MKQIYAAADPFLDQITNPVIGDLGQGEGSDIIAVLIAKGLTVLFLIAGIALLFMILFSALQWITAGGDPEKVKGAQQKLIGAVIGFALLASATVLLDFIGGFFGLVFLQTLEIPWPTL